MQLGLIPPNSLHHLMQRTNFHLLLPWQLKELPEDFIHTLGGHLVLDNGAAEGPAYSFNVLSNLLRKWPIIEEVVIPDRLRDCEMTLANVRFAERFKEEHPAVDVMAVVQGENLAQVMKCYYFYLESPFVDIIGIPRVLNVDFGKHSRVRLLESLAAGGDFYKPLHCLGAYYAWPKEVKAICDIPHVRSMDSSLPFVLGLAGIDMAEHNPKAVLRRPDNYFGTPLPNKALVERIERNVRTYISWAKAS